MVKNYEFITLRSVLIIDGDSNRKLPKMFAGKNLRLIQKKASSAELIHFSPVSHFYTP